MELHLDIEVKLSLKSNRVKCMDLHESQPWMLTALYNGTVLILDISKEVSETVAEFNICEVPVRCARFIPGQPLIVTASDDGYVRIFNTNSKRQVGEVLAHNDYIRSVAVHPTENQVLSACDDGIVQLWEWTFVSEEDNFDLKLKQTVGEHLHYVMACHWDPRCSSCLASCSLDKTVKLWDLRESRTSEARQPFTLEGHESGVTCIEYTPAHQKPMIVSGADDRTVRLWDLESKACFAVLRGHTHNLTAVIFHPSLPLVITGAEDESLRIWSQETLSCVEVLHDDLHRVWALAVAQNGSGLVAVGYDDGAVVKELAMPMMVLTLHVKHGGDSGQQPPGLVLACMSVAGRELAVICVEEDSTLTWFRQAVAEAVGEPVWRMRLVLPDGRLLTHSDDVTLVEHLIRRGSPGRCALDRGA